MNADVIADHYSYHVQWSAEDNEYVGTCDELSGLSWLDESPVKALAGIRKVVGEAVSDMSANGLDSPAPKRRKPMVPSAGQHATDYMN